MTENKRKKKNKLEKKIYVFKNPDKTFHEKWKDGRNEMNFPHPWRAVLLGPPNSGKTLIVKNLILRAKPQFEEVFVIHCDSEYTKEYEDIGAEMLTDIPAPEDWSGEVKTLVVLDDLEYKLMGKEQRRNLDRLFGYVSTHKHISVVLCSQDPFNVPPIVRRCANIWVLWRMSDIDSMANTARKSGMRSDMLKHIFDTLMEKQTDSLWIDLTANSPYPLRKNGFTPIARDT